MQMQELVKNMQISVSPVILISGVGLLLLTMTNRLSRIIERSRKLADLRRTSSEKDRIRIQAQLDILWQQAKLNRLAIAFSSVSALLTAMLIVLLFVGALLGLEIGMFLAFLFGGSLLALIVSLVFFLRDINLVLRAVEYEVNEDKPPRTITESLRPMKSKKAG